MRVLETITPVTNVPNKASMMVNYAYRVMPTKKLP